MRRTHLSLAAGIVLALSACTTVARDAGPGEPRRADEALGFAPASGPLVFPEGVQEVSLAWLIDETARLTGVEFVYDQALRQQLERDEERLEQTEPVPAEEVYPFVEALLVSRGTLLELVKTGTPTMLRLFGWKPGRGLVITGPLVVEDDDLAALASHPALLVQHAMVLRNIDSRQLQTQLRQLLVDPTGTTQAVPAGERGLLIQGPGYRLLPLIRMVREVDRLSGPDPEVPETTSEEASRPPSR